MIASVQDDTDIRKSDKLIPWYFVAFFLSFIVVDSIFAYVAVHTHTGVVTTHAYQEGIHYNAEIAEADAEAALHWRSKMSYGRDDMLHFSLRDKTGAPIVGAQVLASFVRPTTAGHDFSLTLKDMGHGEYEAPVNFPLAGLWDARLFVTWQQHKYQHHERMVVKRH